MYEGRGLLGVLGQSMIVIIPIRVWIHLRQSSRSVDASQGHLIVNFVTS
jgi:hypothetical protein